VSGFRRDERGVTAVLFSIVFAIVFFVAAIALDYAGATKEQARQQAAVDAAALAASQYLGLENQDEDGPEYARRFFKENMGAHSSAEIEVRLDADAGIIEAAADNKYLTWLMKAILPVHLRTATLDVGARATVIKGGRVEVALALDNSGSMAGSKLTTLQAAARDLVAILFAGEDSTGDLRIGVVPFAASVNVGPGNAEAGWIYRGAENALRYPLFTGTASRFDMLAGINRTWAGCTEARPSPYDVNDAIPDGDNTDTVFVPLFAPDEPDDVNAAAAGYSTTGSNTDGYANNYITDFGGTCPAPELECVSWRTRNGVTSCRTWANKPIGVAEAQSRSCKYAGTSPSSFEGSASGPNAACTTPALLPLTTDRVAVENKITDLVANGNTNIAEGASWAWRVLSPTAPFMEGRSYSDRTNRKIMIVMTDGDNYLQSKSQHNKSVYAAFGLGAQNRLGGTHTQNGFMNVLNQKTLAACSNAKSEGITIYTIAFGTEISNAGLSLLRSCATDPNRAFIATNESALIETFRAVAREISKLRVSS
jgi:Flp pilus assembly protein TadG